MAEGYARLLGSTAYGAAVTYAVFFLGLAAGSYLAGRVAERFPRPVMSLRAYAVIEVATALAAVWYIAMLAVGEYLLPGAAARLGLGSGWLLMAKCLFAAIIMLPATIMMGATFPLIAGALGRIARKRQHVPVLLYGANVIGAAAGAFLAGFVLPGWLGFNRSYLIIIAVNLGLAAAAWLLPLRIGKGAVPASLRRTVQSRPVKPVTGLLAEQEIRRCGRAVFGTWYSRPRSCLGPIAVAGD